VLAFLKQLNQILIWRIKKMKKMLFVLTLLGMSFNVFSAVNLNTATQAELESLAGVGPVKAQAILDYRKKNGGFKSVDELEKVDGIGASTVENVRKSVTISGKTSITAAPDKTAKVEPKAKTAKAKTEK
jgi:competence protein ComEA